MSNTTVKKEISDDTRKLMWDYEEFSLKLDDPDDLKRFITLEDYDNIFRKHFKENDEENVNRNKKNANSSLQKSNFDNGKIKNYRYFQKGSGDGGLISIVIADDQTIVYLLANSSLNLICKNPDNENINWYHYNKVVSKEETLTLYNVSSQDSGLYTCKRSNIPSKVAISVLHEIAEEMLLKPTTILDPFENYKLEPVFNFSLQYSTSYEVRFPSPNLHSNTFFDQEIICTVNTNRFLMVLDTSFCNFDELSEQESSEDIYVWKSSKWSEVKNENSKMNILTTNMTFSVFTKMCRQWSWKKNKRYMV